MKIGPIPNVILTDEDYKEIEKTKEELRKVKLPKQSYFTGFKEVKMRKPRKKKQELKGYIQTGVVFIGDAGYMAGDQSQSAEPIQPDPLNPFKDLDAYLNQHGADHNLDLPGSFNGDLPGRGVAIHTGMLNGSYTVKKRVCKQTGKLLEVKIKFKE